MNKPILIDSSMIITMALHSIISNFSKARALLVLAALISLCVSNNVGPSFLPLPVVTERDAQNPRENQSDKAFLPQPSTESDSFRVPMMGQKQNRAATEPQTQLFATTVKAGSALPAETRVAAELGFPIPIVTSASASQPPGRAPPHPV